MVNNDGETFINAKVIQHEEYAELSDVMKDYSSELLTGLMGMEVRAFTGDTDKAIEKLDAKNAPYFCQTMTSENWNDGKKCVQDTKKLLGKLLGKLLEIADKAYFIETWGDYYGDWREMVLIVQMDDNDSPAQSLVIKFDILHEI